jgi:anti-sigma factor RsiW
MSRSAGSVDGCCLGDVAAALVDGELDHAARERAHRHLAHCARCRAEVDGQRRLKARLSGVAQPEPSAALTERLLRLAAPVEEPGLRTPSAARPPSRPVAVAAGPSRPEDSRPASSRPARARARRAARRRTATGSAVALLGVAAALALGAPQPRPATTPVDPASAVFVTEFVSTTADGATPTVAPLPTARTAGLTTFVPLTRSALLTPGGARTTR